MISESLKDMSLNEMIESVQQGNKGIQNYLLKSYQPFVAKCVSEVCRCYIDPKRDDEFSVGLFGFNEAILQYSSEKGSSFFSFAKLVVKRKVIDYIRYVKRHQIMVSLDATFNEESMENPREICEANKVYWQEQEAWQRREEINEFKEKLEGYKLNFAELTMISPKHKDARDSAVRIARILFSTVELREYVHKRKRLPIKDLLKLVNVSKKTIERNRKFILATFIVLSEDYVYLKDYLRGVGQ